MHKLWLLWKQNMCPENKFVAMATNFGCHYENLFPWQPLLSLGNEKSEV